MTLQKYNPQQNLEVIEQIKVALTSSMVKDTPKKGLFDYVNNAITRLYAAARFTPPSPEEMNVIVGETFKVIVETYPTLRYQELDIAFRKGLIGEYGDYMGLSVPTFSNWIKFYMVDKNRLNQLPQKLQIEAPKEPSREQKFALAASNALEAFNKYKAGGDISIIASTVYKTLLWLNLVNYSEEEIKEFEEQARLDVVEELTVQKNLTADKLARKAFQRLLDGGELQEKIVIQARRLGCYEYFKYLILEEIDLANILEEKRIERFGEGENA
jgi:hypothetical protein